MTDFDAAITDFAIAVESAAFAYACARGPRSPSRRSFAALFAWTSAAALTGGLVHGFAADPRSPGYRVLWPATLLAIVGASTAMALASIELLSAGRRWRLTVWVVTLAFVIGVALGADSFAFAVAAYVPASLALTYAFAARYRSRGAIAAAGGAAGLLLGIVAGGLQTIGFTPVPGWIDHNAFYHLLQMPALALLFWAARDAQTR